MDIEDIASNHVPGPAHGEAWNPGAYGAKWDGPGDAANPFTYYSAGEFSGMSAGLGLESPQIGDAAFQTADLSVIPRLKDYVEFGIVSGEFVCDPSGGGGSAFVKICRVNWGDGIDEFGICEFYAQSLGPDVNIQVDGNIVATVGVGTITFDILYQETRDPETETIDGFFGLRINGSEVGPPVQTTRVMYGDPISVFKLEIGKLLWESVEPTAILITRASMNIPQIPLPANPATTTVLYKLANGAAPVSITKLTRRLPADKSQSIQDASRVYSLRSVTLKKKG